MVQFQKKIHVIFFIVEGFHTFFKGFPQIQNNNKIFSSNSKRRQEIPWETLFPPYDFAHYFCTKHAFVLRSTMYLSEGRAVITREAHDKWAKLIQEVISKPDIAEAFLDPRRIWNMVRKPLTAQVLLIIPLKKIKLTIFQALTALHCLIGL